MACMGLGLLPLVLLPHQVEQHVGHHFNQAAIVIGYVDRQLDDRVLVTCSAFSQTPSRSSSTRMRCDVRLTSSRTSFARGSSSIRAARLRSLLAARGFAFMLRLADVLRVTHHTCTLRGGEYLTVTET